MAWPTSLHVALKEWAVVCRALEQGRQMILLRKGGISETGGAFQVEHRQFLLFPTWLHQNKQMLKPVAHADYEPLGAEPAEVSLSAAAVVSDILRLTSRAQMDALDDEHVWTAPLLDMRFGYKPDKPLYLLLLRTYRLPRPATIPNTPAYAGCKSWVPLDQPIALGDAQAAMDNVKFEARRQSILGRLQT